MTKIETFVSFLKAMKDIFSKSPPDVEEPDYPNCATLVKEVNDANLQFAKEWQQLYFKNARVREYRLLINDIATKILIFCLALIIQVMI